VLLCALLVAAALVLSACAEDDGPQPGSVSEAFEAAHPDGGLPPGLQRVDASRGEIAQGLLDAVDGEAPLLLPRWLPAGFGLAAPYVAVGDGSARPNPETWGSSYRVSYTDGSALIVVTVGAEELPSALSWRTVTGEIDGRALQAARSGPAAVVATTGAPLVVVAGERVPLDIVLRVARSMSPIPLE
jgi:hypothetical protein